MRIIVGDEVGLIKRITFSVPASGAAVDAKAKDKDKRRKKDNSKEKAPAFATSPLVESQNRAKAVDALAFAKNKSKVVAATKDGHVQVFDIDSGSIDTQFRLFEPVPQKASVAGNRAREEEHFVGLFEANGTIITCTNKGNVNYHAPLAFLATNPSADPLPTFKGSVDQDALTVMKVFPESPDYFATAGAEREVCLWRVVKDESGTAKLESVWKAKNVANDHLDLRVPVHVTDLQFLPPPAEYKAPEGSGVKPTRIAMVSLHKHFRVYNVYEGKRRPVLSVTVGDMPAKRLAVTEDGSEAIVTDTTGSAIHISTATGDRLGAFKGFQGAVTSIECVNEIVNEDVRKLIVTAGIDRMLRIFLRDGKRTLLHKIYLKHRLHAILIDESFVPPSAQKSKKKPRIEKDGDDEGKEEEEEEEENDEDFFARMQEDDEDDEEVGDDDEEEIAPPPKKKSAPVKPKKRKISS
ncbi:WD repeat-containing protein 74 [Rhizoclosmatium sp. JEL0117]|nr:WD repeat-containing protein 74 [Rhizoclosmatium sp. JEL0117]